MKQLHSHQFGRSMIEMLGILAIVGILSAGGISEFSHVMKKYKLIKVMNEYHMFIIDIMLKYQNEWQRLHINNNNTRVYLAPYIEHLGLPAGWKRKNNIIYDSIGNHFYPFTGYTDTKLGGFDYYIQEDADNLPNEEICRYFIMNVVLPFQDNIQRVSVYRSQESTKEYWFGTPYCFKGKNCLSTIQMTDILRICHTCIEKKGCAVAVYFG